MESGEPDMAMTASRDVPIRDSAPPSSSRTYGRSHEHSWSSSVPDNVRHPGVDVWSGAISRLQTQVSLNTSMLESHRRQLQDVSMRLDGLKQEMGNVVATLHDFRRDLRAKPSEGMPARYDSGDLELLVGQVEAVTSKANEVDAIKLSLDLMKNRMKRLEDQAVTPAINSRPATSTPYNPREPPTHEVPPPPHQMPYQPAHPGPPHQPLPPMRTSSMASPGQIHSSSTHPPAQALEQQGRPSYPPPVEPRHYSTDSSALQPSPIGGFRPSEPLPPPSTLPGWRSSESLPHSTLPPPPPSGPHNRHTTMEPEPHASGWATINSNQPAKRPYEEPRASPYESPGSASPKRPKLAPIMPRGSYGDESYVPSSIGQSTPADPSLRARSRAASDVSQSQSQISSTPATAATAAAAAPNSGPAYRFITSTAQADSQESWRPEHERRMHGAHHGHGHSHSHGGHNHAHGHGGHAHGGHGHGRRGGRRGGRGRRARGGGGVTLAPDSQQELGTPEWEKADWTGSQVGPNGYYHPLHPYSPRAARGGGGMMKRGGGGGGGGADGASAAEREQQQQQEPPETPTHGGGSDDPSGLDAADGGLATTSGGKKSRTKPIRNAEGVLIRKDGRPDMRSVSSANNLRKVHAKKEAERAELGGKTPTSARSLAPAHAYSEDDENASHSDTPGTPAERDEGEDEDHMHEREEEFAGRVSTGSTATRSDTERFYPRYGPEDGTDVDMKTERGPDESRDEAREGGSEMTDVVMREMSEAQAAEHHERDSDIKMPTVDEANEEQEQKADNGEGEQ